MVIRKWSIGQEGWNTKRKQKVCVLEVTSIIHARQGLKQWAQAQDSESSGSVPKKSGPQGYYGHAWEILFKLMIMHNKGTARTTGTIKAYNDFTDLKPMHKLLTHSATNT